MHGQCAGWAGSAHHPPGQGGCDDGDEDEDGGDW